MLVHNVIVPDELRQREWHAIAADARKHGGTRVVAPGIRWRRSRSGLPSGWRKLRRATSTSLAPLRQVSITNATAPATQAETSRPQAVGRIRRKEDEVDDKKSKAVDRDDDDRM